MIFIFSRNHERAYETLIAQEIVGDYRLVPHYEKRVCSHRKSFCDSPHHLDKAVSIVRRWLNKPYWSSLVGGVAQVPINGAHVPVGLEDFAEITLNHEELGEEFRYQGWLGRVIFSLGNEMELEMKLKEGDNIPPPYLKYPWRRRIQ